LIHEIPRKQVPDARINMQLTPSSQGFERGAVSPDSGQWRERVSLAMSDGSRGRQGTDVARRRQIGRGGAALQKPSEPAIADEIERR
jgi:hypothetical protein